MRILLLCWINQIATRLNLLNLIIDIKILILISNSLSYEKAFNSTIYFSIDYYQLR